MAIIICPECGKEISEYADYCLCCGCPMEVIKELIIKNSESFKKKDFSYKNLKNNNK